MTTYVYTGAVPVWKNKEGEQVMRVYGEYRDGERVVETAHEYLTVTGSRDVCAL